MVQERSSEPKPSMVEPASSIVLTVSLLHSLSPLFCFACPIAAPLILRGFPLYYYALLWDV